MKNLKKTMAGMLAMMMLLGAAGCGSKDEGKGDGEVSEVSWYWFGDREEDEQKVWDRINELMAPEGVKVNFEVVDRGAYEEKMNLVITSGADYDICFTSNWLNNYNQNVDKGAYYDIAPLLKTTHKKLYEALPEYVWDITRKGDAIYGVPNQQVMFSQTAIRMTEEMFNKYDMASKQEALTKDFYGNIEPILEQIKKDYPDLYVLRPDSLPTMMPEYETINVGVGLSLKKDFDPENPELVFEASLPQYENYLAKLRDWFDKGYLRSDILTTTTDAADLWALRYGMWFGSYKPGAEAEDTAKCSGVPIKWLTIAEPQLSYDAGQSTITAISAKSKDPEAALKVIEIFNTNKDVYNTMAFGLENEHYTKVGENRIKLADNERYSHSSAWIFGNQFNAYLTEGQEDSAWEETERLNMEATKSKLIGFSPDINSIKSEISQLAAVVKEYDYLKKGAYTPEKYQEFIAKLKKAGVETVVEEIEKQIIEFMKTKK